MGEIKDKTRKELLLEIQNLSARLSEVEETLSAIRSGEVDALVVSTSQGDQIFTLKGAEKPYRILMEKMKEGAVTLAEDNSIFYCNQGFADMLKTPLEKMIGTGISQFVLPADKPVFEELLRRGRAGSSIGEVTFLAGDGMAVPTHLSVNTMSLEGLSTIYLVAIDITEHKQAEEALQKAHDELEIKVQERTAELVNANEELHVEITERKRAEKALQKAHDELEIRVQERTAELQEANVELEAEIAERERAEQATREAHKYAENIVETLRESLLVLDTEMRVKIANQTFYKTFKVTPEETLDKLIYELGNRQWDIPGLRGLLDEIISKNMQFYDFEVDREFPNIGHKTMLLNARLLYQETPGTHLILLAIEDITEKKRLESQVLRSQRMESIGTLAGGIAHDLNNLLTPMMLSLQMLKEKLKDEQSQRLLTVLEQNSQRGANLIKQVMSFARGIEGERKPLQVAHIITEIEKVAKETFPRDIEIRTDISKDLFAVSGDATQLHQVIMNLCVNSRDAMPYGGVLNITAKNISITEDYKWMDTEAQIGQYVLISVSDTGTGIPSKVLDRIFEPFFTTKEHGKGTGLGLSTSLAIVKSHGGFINVESKVGEGTIFEVYLPAIKSELQNAEELMQLKVPTGHGELILIAEDEASISEITSSALKAYGYRVLTAADGADAVALYVQNKNEIKAILMDMMMPVMDGQTSIRAIRRINSEVKIIVVSGLAEKDKLAKVANDNVNAFLPKPYTAERLLKTIHEVISVK